MATYNYGQYNNLERILQDINGESVRLNEEEKKRNNMVLQEVCNTIYMYLLENTDLS